jgi:hypothetical protein
MAYPKTAEKDISLAEFHWPLLDFDLNDIIAKEREREELLERIMSKGTSWRAPL